MVDLKAYGQTEFEGTITSIYIKPLREYLKGKVHPLDDKTIDEKFRNPDRDQIVIYTECEGKTVEGFFGIPQLAGYGKSNLKRFIDKNDLPLVDLPKEVKKWLGKKVKIHLDSDGFLRLAI